MDQEKQGATLEDQVRGQPGEASDQGAAEGGASQAVSPEIAQAVEQVVSKLLPKVKSEVLDEAVRRSQSLVDKADRRITDRLRREFQAIDRYAQMFKSAGIEIDDAMLEQMKQRKVIEELAGEASGGEGSAEGSAQDPQAGQPQTPDPAQSPVMQDALAIMEEAGTFIEDGDPELEMIDLKTPSPYKFLRSVEAAVEAKKKRVAGSKEPNADDGNEAEEDAEDLAARLAARSPGLGAGSGKRAAASPDGLSAMEYLRRGYNKGK